MRLCKLSESAIEKFIRDAEGQARELLFDERSVLDAYVRNVRNEYSLKRSMIQSELSLTNTYIREAVRAAREKYSSVQYHLQRTPKTIKVPRQKTRTVTGADGSSHTESYTEYVEEANPNYPIMVEMERLAKKYLDIALSMNTDAEEKRLLNLEMTVSAFEKQASRMTELFSEMEDTAAKAVCEITEKAKQARKYLKNAKDKIDPLQKLYSDSGVADIDGIESYIQRTRELCTECENAYRELLETAKNMNYGWNDAVYEHFLSVIQNDIENNISKTEQRLQALVSALSQMCGHLSRYYECQPEYREASIYFSYNSVSTEGYQPRGSCSFTVTI